MDFSKFDERLVHAAQAGDAKALLAKLRDPGAVLSDPERQYLAELLEGTPRKAGRKSEFRPRDLMMLSALEWLIEIEGVKRDAAEEQIAAITGQSTRNLRKIKKKYEGSSACTSPWLWIIFPPYMVEADPEKIHAALLRN